MKRSYIITFLGMSFFFVSCRHVLMSVYGLKKPQYLNKERMKKLSARLGIDEHASFYLSRTYFTILDKKDTLKQDGQKRKCSAMISKYQQPLQLLYFNKEGKLVSFHNNCYAGGFPNLHWNHAHQFDHFIPETTIPLTDSALNLKMLLAHIRSIGADTQILTGEITVAVLWAGFMKRQSRGMIRVAKKNLQLDKDKTAKIIFVNTDNCYVEGDYRKRINKIN